jgi:hypothetical protein
MVCAGVHTLWAQTEFGKLQHWLLVEHAAPLAAQDAEAEEAQCAVVAGGASSEHTEGEQQSRFDVQRLADVVPAASHWFSTQ